MVRAIRIPDQNNPKRKYGFVEFDDFDAVDIAIGQGEHKIEGHRVRVELALPQMNDSLYEQARLKSEQKKRDTFKNWPLIRDPQFSFNPYET